MRSKVSMLKFSLFGPFQLTEQSRNVSSMPNGRALALLSYLLLNEGPQNRGHLADLLWDELSDRQAKSNLRYVLYALRKVLGEYLIVTRQTVAFDRRISSWVDANVFSSFMATEFPYAESRLTRDVLELYKGELLAGLHIQDAPNFERWLEDERRRFHEQVIQGWLYLCEGASELGEYDFGIFAGRKLLQFDPGRENAHRLVMRQLAYSGQRTAALAQFALCQEELAREYDVPPDDTTVELFAQIQRGELTAPFLPNDPAVGPTAVPDTRVNPDPVPTTDMQPHQPHINWELIPQCRNFVGREIEVAQLRDLIERETYQIIGMFGLPGIGKSALAAEVTAHLAEPSGDQAKRSFEHILWHSPSRFTSLLELLQAWTMALSAENAPPKSIESCLQLLTAQLRNQRVLLILDDFQEILAHPKSIAPYSTATSLDSTASHDAIVKPSHTGMAPTDSHYKEKWEGMSELLRRLAEVDHGGCLLMLSNIIPTEWQLLSLENSSVRQFSVEEFQSEEVVTLLSRFGLPEVEVDVVKESKSLIANPQFLITQIGFLREYGSTFGLASLPPTWFRENTWDLLSATFHRLDASEREILLSAIELLSADVEQSKTVQELWRLLDGKIAISTYLKAINSLQRYLLINVSGPTKTVTLPQMVRLFAEQYLISSISHELHLLVCNHRQSYMHAQDNFSQQSINQSEVAVPASSAMLPVQ